MIDQTNIIRTFYSAFASFDPDIMAGLYHGDAVFSDPVFGRLKGEDIMHMWRMLIHYGKKDLIIELKDTIQSEENEVIAHWEAKYSFSKTSREIHNKIVAHFTFRDGKIIEHHDQFDLKEWSKMAFGWKGALFGGFDFFKSKIRTTAAKNFQNWKQKTTVD